MKCARRSAGAHRPASPAAARSPASSTSARSPRPDPRRGRSGARLFRLLPVLALLAGALGLFAPAPAQANHLTTSVTVTVTPGSEQLTVTWTAPQSWPAANRMQVRHRVKSPQGSWVGSTGIDLDTCPSRACSWTLTGLTNDTTYEVQVGIGGNFHSHWSSSVEGTPTAQQTATPTSVWSATLTPVKFGSANEYGCSGASGARSCATTSILSTRSFTYDGGSENVLRLSHHNASNRLTLSTSPIDADAFRALTLHVGSNSYAVTSATVSHSSAASTAVWTTSGVSWSTSQLSVSLTAQQQVASVPAKPAGLSVTAGDSKLDLSWTAPSGTLTGYDVHYTSAPTIGAGAVGNSALVQTTANPLAANGWIAVDRGTESSPPVASQSITGLDNGTAYRVRVRAKGAGGAGTWAVESGTPMAQSTTPATPTNFALTAGDAQFTVSWTASTGANSYNIHWFRNSETGWVGTVSEGATPGTATSKVIDRGTQSVPLVNGTVYKVRLRACSNTSVFVHASQLDCSAWTSVKTVTPAAQTSTPSTSALVSNLSQTAGTAVTTASETSAQGFTTGSASGGYTLSSIDLVIGASSTNAAQRATIRAELWSATTGGVPNSKVASLTVPSTVSGGTVSFAAPSNTTLSASTTYFVVIYTVGSLNLRVSSTLSTNEDSGAATGWSIGNRGYYQSSDVPGSGSWPSDSNNLRIRVNGAAAQTTTLNPVSAAPTDLSATPGGGKVTLTWTSPSGLSPRERRFRVEYGEHPSGDLTGKNTGLRFQDSYVITGLTSGTTYRFRLRVAKTSDADPSPWTDWVTATPVDPPGVPTNLAAAPGESKLDVSWTAPSGTVTGYDVHYTASTTLAADAAGRGSGDPASVWRSVSRGTEATPPATAQTVTGLEGGVEYRVRVRTKNAAGESAWVETKGTPTRPAAGEVSGLGVTPGIEKLDLAWTAPSGITVTGYDVHYTSAPGSGSGAVTDTAAVQTASNATAAGGWLAVARGTEATPPAVTQAITGLDGGTEYRVRVRAKYAGGTTEWRFATGTPLRPPEVTNLAAKPDFQQLYLTWTAPSGVTVTGYDIHYTSAPRTGTGAVGDNDAASGIDVSKKWVPLLTGQRSATDTRPLQTLSGLTNGTEFRIRVRAKYASTTTAWAHVSGTPAGPQLRDLRVGQGYQRLDVRWTAPDSTLVKGYQVHYTSAPKTGTTAVTDDAAAQTANTATAATGWLKVTRTGTAYKQASQALTGLTNGQQYRIRVRVVYDNSNPAHNTAWVLGTGTPQACLADCNQLTGIRFSAGVTSLPMERNNFEMPHFNGAYKGLRADGRPQALYVVYVPPDHLARGPGVTTIKVTPVWTDPSMTGVSLSTHETAYSGLPRRFADVDARLDADQDIAYVNATTSGTAVTLRIADNGTTLLDVHIDAGGDDPAHYWFYLQPNYAWRAAETRLKALGITFGN